MGEYIECPNSQILSSRSIFLAGGITGCGNWQEDAAKFLLEEPWWAVLNPRRKSFDANEPGIDEVQIPWEYKMLSRADGILFWFPPDTLCPITLYELGSWIHSKKPIFLGVDPGYKRLRDVEIQTRLVRPGLQIHDNLKTLLDATRSWMRVA